VAAAGALGIGAWWFLFREGDKEDDTSDQDKVYDEKTSADLKDGDRGGSVSGDTVSRQGVAVPRGVSHYRWGNKVTVVNVPPVFGVRSYRRTMCTPTRDPAVEEGEAPWRVYGRARRHDSSTLNGWEWNQAAFQTGTGFENNGAAIVARSWSCTPDFRVGTNNDNCRRTKGFDRALMGFVPLQTKDFGQMWASGGADSVPFIEWNAPGISGNQSQARNYVGLADRQSAVTKPGFLTTEGRLWIFGGASRNFSMIADADKNVRYFYSMVGGRGARTAARVMPGGALRFVERSDCRPIWVGSQSQDNPALTYNEFRRFGAEEEDRKGDPWLHEPFKSIDRAEQWSGSFGGVDYSLDYRVQRGGNPEFRRLIDEVAAQYPRYARGARRLKASSGRVLISYRNAYLGNAFSSDGVPLNWPVVNYGLIDPFRGPASRPNALPVDFAAPVFVNKFFDMLYVNPGFTG